MLQFMGDVSQGTYIADTPDEPGVKCLRIELRRSPAILKVLGLRLCDMLERGKDAQWL